MNNCHLPKAWLRPHTLFNYFNGWFWLLSSHLSKAKNIQIIASFDTPQICDNVIWTAASSLLKKLLSCSTSSFLIYRRWWSSNKNCCLFLSHSPPPTDCDWKKEGRAVLCQVDASDICGKDSWIHVLVNFGFRTSQWQSSYSYREAEAAERKRTTPDRESERRGWRTLLIWAIGQAQVLFKGGFWKIIL